MSNDWVINDIRVSNVAQPSGPVPEDKRTPYHSPRLKRTLMDGPGNRSSIIDCSCGARFEGAYNYQTHEIDVNNWYASHARIEGGGNAVEETIAQYDNALDLRDHPELRRARSEDPAVILASLRR